MFFNRKLPVVAGKRDEKWGSLRLVVQEQGGKRQRVGGPHLTLECAPPVVQWRGRRHTSHLYHLEDQVVAGWRPGSRRGQPRRGGGVGGVRAHTRSCKGDGRCS